MAMISKIFSTFAASAVLAAGVFVAAVAVPGGSAVAQAPAKEVTLYNVSYDPTRELYTAINKAFSEHYKKETGTTESFTKACSIWSSFARPCR